MSESTVLLKPPTHLDYSLTGENAARAIERVLAEADQYQCPVPRATMRKLLERRDGPALHDTLLWFALLLGSGYATFALWGSWWAALPYAVYAVLYASTSDSRWHAKKWQAPGRKKRPSRWSSACDCANLTVAAGPSG